MYSRDIEGETLTFAPSGWTYERTFLLYDHQTESIWYPYVNFKEGSTPLVCISGLYADQVVDEIPSTLTTWRQWKLDNPNTKYVDLGK